MIVISKRNLARQLALAIFACGLTAITASFAHAQGRGGPTAVGMDTVTVEPLAQTVPVIGRFVPHQSGDVAARVAGPVAEYLVKVGDRVEEGDVLARLVDESYTWERNRRRAAVETARARLQTSRASLALLEQELKRLDGLRDSPAFSQARYDDKFQETVRARSEIAEETASLRSAEAELTLGEIALRNTAIVAPYAGAIIRRYSEAGAWVREGDPVVNLLDYNDLEIEADVPANRIDGLTRGRTLDAMMDTGEALQASVRTVIPEENARTRTRRVRFSAIFDGENMSSAANQSVTVMIPVGEPQDVLTVHKDAVLNRGGNQLVVLDDNGKAAFRPVELGVAVGQRFRVIGGLEEGQKVVIRGNERLRPGQDIVDMNAPPPAETTPSESPAPAASANEKDSAS